MKIEKSVLENGFRVITINYPEAKTCVCRLYVGVGSRYETERNNGITHFLEHLFYTRTKIDGIKISNAVAKIGGTSNAGTSKETTDFWIRTSKEYLKNSLEIIFKQITYPEFKEDQIKAELGPIIQEINLWEDSPDERVFWDLLPKIIWGENSFLGREALGSKQTISKLKKEDFEDYRNQFYQPSNMLLVVSGSISQDNIYQEVLKTFGALETKKIQISKQIDTITKEKVLISSKDTKQSHLCLGFASYPRYHQNFYSLQLLGALLAGEPNSRLFTKIREEKGLAYATYHGLSGMQNNSLFGIYEGVKTSKIELALNESLNEIGKVKNREITNKELQEFKNQLKTGYLTESENLLAYNDSIGYEELTQPFVESLEEKIAKIEAVTPHDIQRVANDLFTKEKLKLAIIGPFKQKDEKRFEEILTRD